MKINYFRIFSQDFTFGKIISMTISLGEMAVLLVCKPSKKLLTLFGFILKIKPKYSMLSTRRLLNLYSLSLETQRLKLEGDIVECGVWNGGAAAMTARGCQDAINPLPRTIWLFDSFEGLPPPSERDKKTERECYFEGLCKGDVQNVKDIFQKLGNPWDNVKIIKGWFNPSIYNHKIKNIVLLHLDADWYNCIKEPLEQFYGEVVSGGFVVVDDYWIHQGCQSAVQDFLKENDLKDKIELKSVDYSAVYFQKP